MCLNNNWKKADPVNQTNSPSRIGIMPLTGDKNAAYDPNTAFTNNQFTKDYNNHVATNKADNSLANSLVERKKKLTEYYRFGYGSTLTSNTAMRSLGQAALKSLSL